MAQALAPVEPTTIQEMQGIAQLYAQSGMFPHLDSVSKAFVVIQAGRAWGFGAFASVAGINIIHGRPEMSAGMMSARIKQYMDGKYSYAIERHDNEVCELTFTEDGQEVYRSRFSVQDAEQAGLTRSSMWDKYRRNMLFARALSNGARWVCPDAFGGPTYIAGEISDSGNGLGMTGQETLADIMDEADNADSSEPPDPRDIARQTFPFDTDRRGQAWQEVLSAQQDALETVRTTAAELGYEQAQLEDAIGTTLEDFSGSTAELWLAFCLKIAEDRAAHPLAA